MTIWTPVQLILNCVRRYQSRYLMISSFLLYVFHSQTRSLLYTYHFGFTVNMSHPLIVVETPNHSCFYCSLLSFPTSSFTSFPHPPFLFPSISFVFEISFNGTGLKYRSMERWTPCQIFHIFCKKWPLSSSCILEVLQDFM